MTATQNKAPWSGSSLAMAVAVAATCTLLISPAEIAGQQSSEKPQALVLDTATLQTSELVAKAVEVLARLEQTMAKFTPRLCQDTVPEHLIKNQPFGLVADNLRHVEQKFRELGVYDGRQGDLSSVIQALAKARSVAATNDKLIRQHTTVPKIIESDINLDALKTLADHTTRRLGEMVS